MICSRRPPSQGWVAEAKGLAGQSAQSTVAKVMGHACKVTCEALRPEIWSLVLALADELERTGYRCPDAMAEFLPMQDFHWPPSAATRWRGQPAVEQ